MPLIESALAEKKVQAARPDYEADLGAPKATKDADAEDGDESEKNEGNADDDEEEK